MARSFLLVALATALSLRAPPASLRVHVFDAQTGRSLPCTIEIRGADGKIVADHPSFRDGIRSSGESEKQLDAGRVTIVVSRGFDYVAQQQNIDLHEGETREMEFRLERRTPLRALGWYTGDNHDHMIHGERTIEVGFDYVALAARAEGLDYLSVTNHWNSPDVSPEAMDRACARSSTPDFLLMWNLEAPKNFWKGDSSYCVGHGWTLGMGARTADGRDGIQELLSMSAWDYESEKASFPNFEIHALIHELGGIAAYTHPHRWWCGEWGGRGVYPLEEKKRISNMAQELPFDTVAGPTYDAIDIMMKPEERETARRALELWFLLLNHGYRIAATASSDTTFDNPGGGVPGKVRLYTRIDGKLSPQKLARAVKGGDSFVTSGPLVLFQIDEHGPGDVVKAEAGRKHMVRLRAWASGALRSRLRRVELIRNGAVTRVWEPADGAVEFTAEEEIEEGGTAWYVARCFGQSETEVAITNPVYFEGAEYHPPVAAAASVSGSVTDAKGLPVEGTIEIMRMDGQRPVKTGDLPISGGRFAGTVPATARLRATAPGYSPVLKSVFMDYAPLLDGMLQMTPEQLSDWATYEGIRRTLQNVRIDFRMEAANATDRR